MLWNKMCRRGYVLGVLSLILATVAAGQAMKPGKQAKDTTTHGKEARLKNQKVYGVIETSMGKIEIELYPSDAPKTVENFVRLAEKKYFDKVTFHRVAKGFVIQGGDPAGNGSGGTSVWGKSFEDELNPNTPSYKEGYKKGVVAMANSGPNTNGSQFFIMLNDSPRMPKLYSIFGKVVSGMDVVDKIGQVEITPVLGPTDGRPKVPVVMKKVTIRREGVAPNKGTSSKK